MSAGRDTILEELVSYQGSKIACVTNGNPTVHITERGLARYEKMRGSINGTPATTIVMNSRKIAGLRADNIAQGIFVIDDPRDTNPENCFDTTISYKLFGDATVYFTSRAQAVFEEGNGELDLYNNPTMVLALAQQQTHLMVETVGKNEYLIDLDPDRQELVLLGDLSQLQERTRPQESLLDAIDDESGLIMLTPDEVDEGELELAPLVLTAATTYGAPDIVHQFISGELPDSIGPKDLQDYLQE
ncbi:hypothetical protein HN587_01355 [Candidatus Woesearchaeota archaeon]|jgi:hypothetical protein|nr:hypothetical protein [Candidatus Woesearchaeota archaeon]